MVALIYFPSLDQLLQTLSWAVSLSCSSLSGIPLLGMVLFTLTATVDSLRPPACENGSISCRPPSRIQFAVLYASIDLASSGVGGDRFTIATIGANQFDKLKYQGIFFNWFFFTLYTASVISATAIVYIEDIVSWGLGFGLCAVANLIGLIIFFMGSHLYHHDKPQCSPFDHEFSSCYGRSIQKRKVLLSSGIDDDHYRNDGKAEMVHATPKKSFGCKFDLPPMSIYLPVYNLHLPCILRNLE